MQQGDVAVNERVVTKSSAKVRVGDHLRVSLRPTDQAQAFKAEPIALDVVHEDGDLLVINKPAGLVVHPAAGHWSGTLMNGLLHHHAGAHLLPRAGIVHRLDKDTSGLMVVAKTRTVMESLVRQIAARDVHRYYLAITEKAWSHLGVVSVTESLGRDPVNRLRMAVLPRDASVAKPARTLFKPVATNGDLSLVACKLYTGRTHQIRVHLAWYGHPILGDLVYGGRVRLGMQRQALHATRLELVHPGSGAGMVFEAPLPTDMENVLQDQSLHYNTASLGLATFGLPLD
jgi:23S rRNA pseudouridine1911/1915/1917 synthase